MDFSLASRAVPADLAVVFLKGDELSRACLPCLGDTAVSFSLVWKTNPRTCLSNGNDLIPALGYNNVM